MKLEITLFNRFFVLGIVIFFQGCTGHGERSSISKPVGPLRNIPIKSGQVWSGSYDPDGERNGGTFSMVISELDNQGNFSGYMKTALLFKGTGPISGNASGSTVRFTLQRAVEPSNYEDYVCSYSDHLRGRYVSRKNSATHGAFVLSISSVNEQQFMLSYNKMVSDEKASLARSNQSRESIIVYSDTPTYNNSPLQNYSNWGNQQREEQLMERQTEAIEQIQRDASWNNFEKSQRFPWQN